LKCSGDENLEQRRKTVSEEAEAGGRLLRKEKQRARERKRGRRKTMREEEGDDTWERGEREMIGRTRFTEATQKEYDERGELIFKELSLFSFIYSS